MKRRSLLDRLFNLLGGELRTKDDLLAIIRDASQRGLVAPVVVGMIEGVFRFSNCKVEDVMVQRSQMVVVETGWTLEKMLEVITESGHSRFPVQDTGNDKFVGLLLAKDLLRYALPGESRSNFEIHNCLRDVVFVPESQPLNVLLDEFKRKRTHMALVVAEYNNVVGLVTIEDVLEQIVGEIDDEFDINEEGGIVADSEGGFTVRASTPIELVNQTFKTHFNPAECETLAGFLMKEAGRVPRQGETFQLEGLDVTVLSADARRVKQLHVRLKDNTVLV